MLIGEEHVLLVLSEHGSGQSVGRRVVDQPQDLSVVLLRVNVNSQNRPEDLLHTAGKRSEDDTTKQRTSEKIRSSVDLISDEEWNGLLALDCLNHWPHG